MEQLQRLVQAVDDFQRRHRWLAFPVAVVKKFGEDQAGHRAALLAYYGFFSLFPLLLVAVTVLGFLLQGDAELGQRIVDSALAQFPIIGEQLRGTVEGSRLRGSGLALTLGLLLALWGGLGVAEAAQSAMNGIWNVPRRRYPNFLLRRLRGLAWLVILGGGLLLASVISGFAAAADTAWSGPAGVAAATAVNMLLFLLGFRVLTVRNVSLRSLLPGAVLAALAWALLQWLGGWFVARQLSRASATYGAFALVIGLLSWLYVASMVTLFAAELNVVMTRRLWPRSLAPPPLGGADERALEGLAKQEERLPDQRVEVSFDGDAEPPEERAGERGPPTQTG
ncbi:MAG TPA: YihY/virulence factor BrkB family protein [Actinomycetes bacterium]|nr:YihY/virulence factor BrkB family protein [Actinomycetes bacterium]